MNLNSRFVHFVIAASIISIVSVAAWLFSEPRGSARLALSNFRNGNQRQAHHPIDDLLKQGEKEYRAIIKDVSKDVKSAARAYRRRRGRHPPPNFDAWFQYAQERNAVISESLFDQIYHDLNPFWGIEAAQIRNQAYASNFTISVRNHNATFITDHERAWMNLWHNLVQTIAEYLPDVDIPINVMDESRIIVSWETINEYMIEEARTRGKLPEVQEVVSEYQKLQPLPPPTEQETEQETKQEQRRAERFDPEWIKKGPYWNLARVGCPPETAARYAESVTEFSGPPPLPLGYPENSHLGYVKNWTQAKDPCLQPHLRELHGTFVEPISLSTTKKLIPMFGGSKLPINNEILIPPAMYWSKDEFFEVGEHDGGPWQDKENLLAWRGSASGGRNRKENWTRFQRHRFLSMVNGTLVHLAETSSQDPPNFVLPSYDHYNLKAPRNGYLGKWLDEFSDCSFTNLLCFPGQNDKHCTYTDPYYEVKEVKPLSEQFSAKYLPDLDGNSFSGRYRSFLRSTSVPIKATVYNEWHDSRLIPWKHFVPMDNTFIDIYGIMDYFYGYNGVGARDEAAKNIALAGKEWADKVLRREDMQIYMFRLLLEYGRLCDDQRLKLGYVEDLKKR
ncbi:glycosyltransferase family 90 protein [Patellaria atrata CBS 101060]|uniref:Glycosyltransferase family 90 protein n=1 Tax=Patellaria atrata CBS 101060 TaxID=1346257 RepID=A0A9P4SIP4_9PEZI|nr:glycosyltransferase family 90 protein [Patellaria atrata CBS 101060]